MAGTKEGARKAVAKILARDPEHFRTIGRKGGKNGRTGGFAGNRELASVAGAKGGATSRRKKALRFKIGDRVRIDLNSKGVMSRSSRGKIGTITEYEPKHTFPINVHFDSPRQVDERYEESDLVLL